jgi:hypothetical protein
MSAEARLAAGEQRFEDIERRLGSIETKLDSVIETQLKQRGFIAGFSAACSVLIAAIVALVTYIWRQYTT